MGTPSKGLPPVATASLPGHTDKVLYSTGKCTRVGTQRLINDCTEVTKLGLEQPSCFCCKKKQQPTLNNSTSHWHGNNYCDFTANHILYVSIHTGKCTIRHFPISYCTSGQPNLFPVQMQTTVFATSTCVMDPSSVAGSQATNLTKLQFLEEGPSVGTSFSSKLRTERHTIIHQGCHLTMLPVVGMATMTVISQPTVQHSDAVHEYVSEPGTCHEVPVVCWLPHMVVSV